jgi:hypothetical protein
MNAQYPKAQELLSHAIGQKGKIIEQTKNYK